MQVEVVEEDFKEFEIQSDEFLLWMEERRDLIKSSMVEVPRSVLQSCLAQDSRGELVHHYQVD